MRYLNTGKNKIIGLISSVPAEGGLFIKKLRRTDKNTGDYPEIYIGNLSGKEVVYSVSGIGKTNASHAATLLIRDYSPAIIINFGVGGAYPSAGLKVGDIAVATKEIYADEGVLVKEGFSNMQVTGIPIFKRGNEKYFNEFPLDKAFFKKAVKSFGSSHPPIPPLVRGGEGGVKFKSGAFVTVSACTGTIKRALELEKRFKAICENMEGASIAHLCCLYKIPCIEIRGISNIVEDRDTEKWNIRLAAENCQKALINLLATVKLWDSN